ncbi:Uncharacterized protein TCAP_05199 [Tolypocladium capitatum]|uniref:Uncharacterized protein n=1 Tax=Tolypocladium capitatum TaxID=45235 RepID=A0A2K3QBD5_9HYPO|nr:Uncharacterized protein TCAP_05199 [Tolypocladium capitatum]
MIHLRHLLLNARRTAQRLASPRLIGTLMLIPSVCFHQSVTARSQPPPRPPPPLSDEAPPTHRDTGPPDSPLARCYVAFFSFLSAAAMSSSIIIPTGRSAVTAAAAGYHHSSKAVDSSSGSSYSSSPSPSSPSSTPNTKMLHARRPSLLSTAISKQESTVINIGDPDGPPRLVITPSPWFGLGPRADGPAPRFPIFPRARASSGTQIFLPSYVDCDYEPLENQCEPVHEIVLSDEETRAMLPQ